MVSAVGSTGDASAVVVPAATAATAAGAAVPASFRKPRRFVSPSEVFAMSLSLFIFPGGVPPLMADQSAVILNASFSMAMNSRPTAPTDA